MNLEEALLIDKYLPNPDICGYDDNGTPTHLFRGHYCVICNRSVDTISEHNKLYKKAQEVIKAVT